MRQNTKSYCSKRFGSSCFLLLHALVSEPNGFLATHASCWSPSCLSWTNLKALWCAPTTSGPQSIEWSLFKDVQKWPTLYQRKVISGICFNINYECVSLMTVNASQLLSGRLLMKLATRVGSGRLRSAASEKVLRRAPDIYWFLLKFHWYLADIPLTKRNECICLRMSECTMQMFAGVQPPTVKGIFPCNFRMAKTIALDPATQPTSQQGSHCRIKLVIDVGGLKRL